MNGVYALPRISPRLVPVWRRNFLVWRKLAVPSMLGNLGDPLIYMLGLGYGLGVDSCPRWAACPTSSSWPPAPSASRS